MNIEVLPNSDLATRERDLDPENLAEEISEIPRGQLTSLENLFSRNTREKIACGKENPDAYEAFAVREIMYSPERVIWLCFNALGAYDDPVDLESVHLHSITPRQGTVALFSGPTAIAGYTPEQSVRATDRVMAAVDDLLKKYPDHQVRVFGFSAGNQSAFATVGHIGLHHSERRPDRVIHVAPPLNAAEAIFGADVAIELQKSLLADGINKNIYREKLSEHGLILAEDDNNAYNYKFHPPDGTEVIYGRNDGFVHPAQTKAVINFLRDHGINTRVEKLRADHVSLPAYLGIAQQVFKKDIYATGYGEPVAWWSHPETAAAYREEIRRRFHSQIYISDEEQKWVLEYLIENSGHSEDVRENILVEELVAMQYLEWKDDGLVIGKNRPDSWQFAPRWYRFMRDESSGVSFNTKTSRPNALERLVQCNYLLRDETLYYPKDTNMESDFGKDITLAREWAEVHGHDPNKYYRAA